MDEQFTNNTVLGYCLIMVTKHLWRHYPFEKNHGRYRIVHLSWQLSKIHLRGWKYKETAEKKWTKIYVKKVRKPYIKKEINLPFYFFLLLLFSSVVVLQSCCFSPVISSKDLPNCSNLLLVTAVRDIFWLSLL